MKNILLFALVAGVVGAVAIYFTTSKNAAYLDDEYITDADLEDFDMRENNGPVKRAGERGFNAMG